MTKNVIANERSCRGNLILTTTEKPSLRTNEVAVAISYWLQHQKVITSLPLAGVVIAYWLPWYGVNVFFNNQYYGENMRFLTVFGMTPSVSQCGWIYASSSFHSSEQQKRNVIARQRSCRGNRILTTTERLSLRAPESCVAIPLLTIHKCLNLTPRFFAPRSNALLFVYADPMYYEKGAERREQGPKIP